MTKTEARRARRRAYERPELHRIKLTADEVLAKGCKIQAGPGGFQDTGCLAGGCFNNGS